MSSDDVGIYCKSLRELFLQPNKQLFDLQLENKIKGYKNNSGHRIEAWSQEFLDYYNSNINPEIESLAAWSIRPIFKKLFNFFTGVTLKILNERIELPLDVVVLSLQQLSIYYSNEIKIRFGNRGNYRIRPQYKELCFIDSRFVNTRDSMAPSEIIKSLILDKEELLRLAGVKFDTISASDASSHGSSSEQTSSNSGTCSEEEILPILEVASTIDDLNLDDSPKLFLYRLILAHQH
ncbi:unnamed protein product [Brachionus calyciflorus]|uniref:Uncharacterized protein n=1 Tax=Brachionus calyciflorus TaxID=104777 RepID=A0A814FU49_9BILA|nr:unnamed protein product [Brachionus calyciflorus]